MDVVIEVRDARIPLATSHPQVDFSTLWLLIMSAYSWIQHVLQILNSDLKLLNIFLSVEQLNSWIGNRKRLLVLNREDMISSAERNAWATYFARQGAKVVFSNGQLGMVSRSNLWFCFCLESIGRTIKFVLFLQGALKLGRLAKSMAVGVNAKRRTKGLLPRAVWFLHFLNSILRLFVLLLELDIMIILFSINWPPWFPFLFFYFFIFW